MERTIIDTEAVATTLATALKAIGSPERALQERRYLKSTLKFLGVTLPEIRRITRTFLKEHPDFSRQDLLALTKRLWQTDIHELHTVTVILLVERARLLTADDLGF